MRRTVCWSTKFKKDYRRMMKRGKGMGKLDDILEMIEAGLLLPPELYDHPLYGDMRGCRELHVEPDWLLVYEVDGESLTFVRTGSHTDLFG